MDASYAMRPYCWSHTGSTISLVWGLGASMSKIHKLDQRKSTDVELIGGDDCDTRVPIFGVLYLCIRVRGQGGGNISRKPKRYSP